MIGRCIPYGELPGTTKLVADFVHAFERVAPFYSYDPADPDAVARRLEALSYGGDRRTRLVEVLRKQNGDSEALRRLGRADGVAVVTGQQVGLFTGPALTFYKALTAVILADRLTGRGIPASAVFWLASEDHDVREIQHCWVFDGQGVPVRLSAADGQPAERRPAGLLPVPEGVVEQFLAATGQWPHAAATAELLGRCYVSGKNFAEAFAALLRELLGPDRLLTFDPLAPCARDLVAEPLAAAAANLRALRNALVQRASELVGAGYHLQVRVERGASLLFLLAGGQRLPVRVEGDAITVAGSPASEGTLSARAKELSPGALLRPVVQEWLFPTVVSVVGPAEVGYLAQSSALYDILGVGKPIWRLRASCTLLDARTRRLFERYGLQLADFYGGEQAFSHTLGERAIASDLRELVQNGTAQIRAVLEHMATSLGQDAGPLARCFAKSRQKIEYQLAKICRSAAREGLRRDEIAARHARWLYNQVFPNRSLQERVYSIVAFLARDGMDLVERLPELVSVDCLGHQLIPV